MAAIEAILHCPMCYELYDLTYRNPKVLACGHTFCLECLKQHVNRSGKTCPTDNTGFTEEPHDVKDNILICPFLDSSGAAKTDSGRNHAESISARLKLLQAKREMQSQFQRETALLMDMLESLEPLVATSQALTGRLRADLAQLVARGEHVQQAMNIVREIPGAVGTTLLPGCLEEVQQLVALNKQRVSLLEEQHGLLSSARRCTLRLRAEDSGLEWGCAVRLGPDSAPEERVLVYLLYTLLRRRDMPGSNPFFQNGDSVSRANWMDAGDFGDYIQPGSVMEWNRRALRCVSQAQQPAQPLYQPYQMQAPQLYPQASQLMQGPQSAMSMQTPSDLQIFLPPPLQVSLPTPVPVQPPQPMQSSQSLLTPQSLLSQPLLTPQPLLQSLLTPQHVHIQPIEPTHSTVPAQSQGESETSQPHSIEPFEPASIQLSQSARPPQPKQKSLSPQPCNASERAETPELITQSPQPSQSPQPRQSPQSSLSSLSDSPQPEESLKSLQPQQTINAAASMKQMQKPKSSLPLQPLKPLLFRPGQPKEDPVSETLQSESTANLLYPEDVRKIYVGGVPPSAKEADLRAIFGPYGTISDVGFLRSIRPTKNGGTQQVCCAFITFKNGASVKTVLDNRPFFCRGESGDWKLEVEEKKSRKRVTRSTPQTGVYPTQTCSSNGDFRSFVEASEQGQDFSDVPQIFVGRVPESATEEELTELFSSYGHVVYATKRSKFVEGGEKRVFAFISFDDPAAVERVIQSRPIKYYGTEYPDGFELNVRDYLSKPTQGAQSGMAGEDGDSFPSLAEVVNRKTRGQRKGSRLHDVEIEDGWRIVQK